MGSLKVPALVANVTDNPLTAVRPSGRLTHDPARKVLAIHDGLTPGGIPLALDIFDGSDTGRSLQDKVAERRTLTDEVGGKADGVSSNATALDELLAHGRGIIPYATNVYVLDRPVIIPSGTVLTHEGSPTILYKGAAAIQNTGILEFGGNDIAIRPVDNSVLTIEALNPSGHLYAVHGIATKRIEIGNVMGRNCSHFLLRTSAPSYAAANDNNSPRDIKVYGGGAKFDALPSLGLEGAGYLGYTFDFEVAGCEYVNCVQGIQWWGGNSNPSSDGDYANPRKCGRGTIRNVTVNTVHLGGIWGSMGQDILVEDCRVSGCHDVGFDAEGCFRVRFVNSFADNCDNGPTATFFINEDVVFDGITGSSAGGPVYRNYNSQQNFEPRSVTLRGCTFTGTGASPSTIDTQNGPCQLLTVENCKLNFVRIAFVANNLNVVNIHDNQLVFDRTSAAPFDAIAVAGVKAFTAAGSLTRAIARVSITGNRVEGRMHQPAGTRAIAVVSDDGNTPVAIEIRANKLWLGLGDPNFAPIYLRHAGGNAGVLSYFGIYDNRTQGQIQTTSAGAAAPGVFDAGNNKSFTLGDVPLTGVAA